jgi:hypothetical protein
MICGLARFSVWESTLEDQLSIRLPKSQWDSGTLIVWSPESRSAHRIDHPGDKESPKWEDKLLIIGVHELVQTMPEPEAFQPQLARESNGEAPLHLDLETPARASTAGILSHSLPLLEEDEEGVMPLNSPYANRAKSPDVPDWGNVEDALNTVSPPIVPCDPVSVLLSHTIKIRWKICPPH